MTANQFSPFLFYFFRDIEYNNLFDSMFKIWYLLIILLIVLVISVFLVPRFLKEGMEIMQEAESTNPVAVQSHSNVLQGDIHFSNYSKNVTLHEIFNVSPYPMILFDAASGNVIETLSLTSNTYTLIKPNGAISTNSVDSKGGVTSVQETSGATIAKDAWSYVTDGPNSVAVVHVPNGSSVYLYTFDVKSGYLHSYVASKSGVSALSNLSGNLSDVSATISANTPVAIAQYIASHSPKTGMVFYNNAYYAITDVPSGGTPFITILDTKYNLKYAGSGSSLAPSPTPASSVAPTSASSVAPTSASSVAPTSSGSSTCTGNLINVLNDLNTLADLTSAYGQKINVHNGSCNSGSANVTNGCAADNNNYMLKTEIVPPVCPQCPCGKSNCPLSINSSGQVVDCNGNPVTNFGSSPSVAPASNGPSSMWSRADNTIGGGITTAAQTAGGVANTAITTTGDVASNVAGAGAAVGLGAEGAASNIAGTAGGVANNAIGSTAGIVNKTVGTVGGAVTGLESGVANVITGLGNDVTKLGTTTINAVGGLGKGLSQQQTQQTQQQVPIGQVPYYYPGYAYPYTGYGGYYAQPVETCSQTSTYLPLTNDFSAFGR